MSGTRPEIRGHCTPRGACWVPGVGLQRKAGKYEGFGENAQRVRRRTELIEIIEGKFGEFSTRELLAKLQDAGVPAGIVRTLDEVYAWDQVASQGLLIDVEHPLLGSLTLPGAPLRFFAPDGTEHTNTDHQAPPLLNQHGDSIRSWLVGK